MATSLSVKNVPDEVVRSLKARAAKNHRSLQGEILSILEESVRPTRLDIRQLRDRVRSLGMKTGDDATAAIRGLRDER